MKHLVSRSMRNTGFALLMVLGALVVLTLLAGATATTVARLREAAIHQRAQLLGTIDAYSTQQTVLFMLATQRMTFGGLTVNNAMVLNAQDQAMQGKPGTAGVLVRSGGQRIAHGWRDVSRRGPGGFCVAG